MQRDDASNAHTNNGSLPQRLFTVKDIMDIFGIGKNKAYALMHSKGFPTIYIGKDMRVHPQKLQEWIDNQANTPRYRNHR